MKAFCKICNAMRMFVDNQRGWLCCEVCGDCKYTTDRKGRR